MTWPPRRLGSAQEEDQAKSGLVLPAGFANLGNTCYMNSVLQALAHVPPLRAYFASGEFRYDINTRSKFGARGALATAFGELLGELDESEEAVTPDNFKRTLGDWNDTFAGFGQQDASEFLQQLLEGLGEDLNRVEDKPYVENPDVAGDAESPFPADPRVQVDVAAAVDVMHLIEKVNTGYKRESVGAFGENDDNLPVGYTLDDDEDWEDEDGDDWEDFEDEDEDDDEEEE